MLVISFIFIVVNFSVFGLYNYYRYGSFFDNGFGYTNFHPKFSDLKNKIGIFNISYLPHNSFIYFLNTLGIQERFPFIKPDPEGNSLFSTSPLFILLIGIISIIKIKKDRLTILPILLTIVPYLISLLLYFGTGWFQFGQRYALDIIPLLILLLAWVLPLYPKSFVYFLFIISVIINTLGTVWMLMLAPKLYY